MNLRDLKYLIAVAETLHFGKAAEQCFVSQPTLSGQIKKLEEQLQITAFERTNRSVTITPIGQELVRRARLIMEQVQSIEQLALAQRDPMAGDLRIGMIPTISPYLIPIFLQPMEEQFPQLKPVFIEDITDVLLQRLGRHEIDVAIIATDTPDQDFETLDLFDEPFWLAHPANQEQFNRESISTDDLDDCNLLLLSDGHCLADQVRDICSMQQKQQFADIQATSMETLLQLVSANYGCTLVPALSIRSTWSTDMGIVVRELSNSNAYRRIRFCYRTTFPRKKAVQSLAKIILGNLPDTVKKLAQT